jgi:hypothetical protein
MIKFKHLVIKTLAVGLIGMITALLYAQLPAHIRDYPLASRKTSGDLIAPFFDGWIRNEDRSVAMVFGFMNRFTKKIANIPLGSNNYIEPTQFDGAQATGFPVYDRPDFRGIRDRGAFAVMADMAGIEVVWTLKHAGHSYSIPSRDKSSAYQMSNEPLALGSLNQAIPFYMDGTELTDREGIYAFRITTAVAKPLNLPAYVQDRGELEGYEVKSLLFPVGTEWRVLTQATCWEPGEYVIRLRADNFTAPDSGLDYQRCWSNAYVPVTVTP